MSKVIWIPGVGNTTTFDDALIPPGGYLVSPPSSPVPASAQKSTTEQPTMQPGYAQSGSGSSSGGGGPLLVGGAYAGGGWGAGGMQSGGTMNTLPIPTAQQLALQQQAARAQEKARNTVWSNSPDIRAIEERSWDIYVQTGRWDTQEQLALHQQAEDMRKALNPLYKGSGAAGPITQADQNAISLPQVLADPTIGKIAPVAILGIGALLLIGLVKG